MRWLRIGLAVALRLLKIAAVLALLVCLSAGVLLAVLWHSESSLSPECDLDLNRELRSRIGQQITFREFTDFQWRELRIYPEYGRFHEARELGLDYRPFFDHVPEGSFLVAFLDATPRIVCASLGSLSPDYHLDRIGVVGDREIYRVEAGPRNYQLPPDPLDDLELEELDPAVRSILSLDDAEER